VIVVQDQDRHTTRSVQAIITYIQHHHVKTSDPGHLSPLWLVPSTQSTNPAVVVSRQCTNASAALARSAVTVPGVRVCADRQTTQHAFCVHSWLVGWLVGWLVRLSALESARRVMTSVARPPYRNCCGAGSSVVSRSRLRAFVRSPIRCCCERSSAFHSSGPSDHGSTRELSKSSVRCVYLSTIGRPGGQGGSGKPPLRVLLLTLKYCLFELSADLVEFFGFCFR